MDCFRLNCTRDESFSERMANFFMWTRLDIAWVILELICPYSPTDFLVGEYYKLPVIRKAPPKSLLTPATEEPFVCRL